MTTRSSAKNKEESSDVLSKLESMEQKMDKMLKNSEEQKIEIAALKKKMSSVLDENQGLKKQVEEMKDHVDELQQRSRMNNIIINGIQQNRNEDIYKVVEQIGLKLKIKDPLSQVQVAHRVNSTNKDKSKPIVVRLLNTKTRDQWTSAYRSNKLWEQNFYVNEHLTKRNQDILYKTKKFKAENGFKYVWVRDCKIFIRKTENTRVFVIRREEDLKRVLVPGRTEDPFSEDDTSFTR